MEGPRPHDKASALRLTIGVTFEQKRPNQKHDNSADDGDKLAVAHIADLLRLLTSEMGHSRR